MRGDAGGNGQTGGRAGGNGGEAGGGAGGAGGIGGGTGAPHLPEATLHDYVDGTLTMEARREVEGHLDDCPSCRAEAARLRGLLGELASLPAGIAPERDLLPGIEAAIDARAARRGRPEGGRPGAKAGHREETVAGVRPGAGRDPDRVVPAGVRDALRAAPVPLAAAALVLVAASSLVTVALLGGPGGRGDAGERSGGPGAGGRVAAVAVPASGTERGARAGAYRAVEAQYVTAARELARTLDARRDELSPATVRLVEENLRVIDEALAEARAALDADPGNPVLRRMVVATHERKLEFLRRAARVAGEEGDS